MNGSADNSPPAAQAVREERDCDTLRRLLASRHSCRGFLAREVAPDTIDAMLALAQMVPSGCNSQPWHVTVTSGRATERFREALTERALHHPASPDLPFPREYRGAYRQRRRDAALALYNSVGVAPGDRAASARQMLKNFSFFGAPHVAIVTTDEALGTYGAIDCGLYVGAFLLAAECFKVAAVPQGAVAEQAGFIRQHFGLGDDRIVVCAISFGYADPDHPANAFRTSRAAIAEAATLVRD